jgi:hypothetical protein
MRTLVVLSVAALLLAAPVYAVRSAAQPDITVLIKQATAKIRANPKFKKAVLLEADGSTARGKTTKASAITRWRIVFQNQTTKGSKFKSVWVKVVNGKIGQVHGVRSPFLEDRNIAVVPKMTLAAAVAKLRKAGHKDAFANVTLRWPIEPGFKEPLYIFGYAGDDFWAVGTKSGKVRRIS